MSTFVRHTTSQQRLPVRIRTALADRGPMTVEDLAAEICAPGGDAVDRCRRSLDVLERRGLVVQDGGRWRVVR